MLDILGDLLTCVQSHHDQVHGLATFSKDLVTIARNIRLLVKLVRDPKPKKRLPPRRKSPHP